MDTAQTHLLPAVFTCDKYMDGRRTKMVFLSRLFILEKCLSPSINAHLRRTTPVSYQPRRAFVGRLTRTPRAGGCGQSSLRANVQLNTLITRQRSRCCSRCRAQNERLVPHHGSAGDVVVLLSSELQEHVTSALRRRLRACLWQSKD